MGNIIPTRINKGSLSFIRLFHLPATGMDSLGLHLWSMQMTSMQMASMQMAPAKTMAGFSLRFHAFKSPAPGSENRPGDRPGAGRSREEPRGAERSREEPGGTADSADHQVASSAPSPVPFPIGYTLCHRVTMARGVSSFGTHRYGAALSLSLSLSLSLLLPFFLSFILWFHKKEKNSKKWTHRSPRC